MKAPERIPLSRKTADSLELAIRSRQWTRKLPGYRKLCEMLGVSPHTMHTALEILTRRKVILPVTGTRSRLIHPELLSQPTLPPKRDSLLIVTNRPLQVQELLVRQIVEKISVLFHHKDWTVDYAFSAELSAGTPRKEMEELAANYREYRWLLIHPSYAMISWAMSKHLRIVCIGGETQEKKPPTVTASITAMITQSIQHLAELGHRRICTLSSHYSCEARSSLINAVRETLMTLAIPFHPIYNLPDIVDNDADGLWKSLHTLWTHSPPSAIVATNAQQLITIYSYCLKHKLRIPEDLSVILTQNGRNLPWFHPSPAHYSLPAQQYVNAASRWIEHYPVKAVEPIFLTPEFHAAESTARH